MAKQHFALIFSAEPRWWYERHFDRPRGLLDLGTETLAGRLVRQLKREGVRPIIGIGRTTGKERNRWPKRFVRQFKELGCSVVPASRWERNRRSGGTIWNLIKHMLDNGKAYGATADSAVFTIYGDYVFSDELLKEMVAYPRPCAYLNSRKEWGLIVPMRLLPTIYKLRLKGNNTEFSRPVLFVQARRKALRRLGFVWRGSAENRLIGRCVEVGGQKGLRQARDLVLREGREDAT